MIDWLISTEYKRVKYYFMPTDMARPYNPFSFIVSDTER